MPEKLHLTGQRFGRLFVIEEAGKKGKHRRWLCQCDCGERRVIQQAQLRSGRTSSCGCKRKEWMKPDMFTSKRNLPESVTQDNTTDRNCKPC